MTYDADAQLLREHDRHQAVEAAIYAADTIILDSSDGTSEMTDSLTLGVAIVLLGALDQGFETTMREVLFATDPRQAVIVKAVTAAYIQLEDFPEDDPTVKRLLQYELAARFVQKVGFPIMGEVSRHDMSNPVHADEE